MKRTRLFSIVLTIMIMIPILFGFAVHADGAVVVNLTSDTTTAVPGDTIAVRVDFASFPNLTRFGPIEVQFDKDYVEFMGLDKGTALPSTFSLTHVESTSVVSITGLDQTVEDQIATNAALPTVDEAGNPVTPPSDPSMSATTTVTVCILYFKVLDDIDTGDIQFWLGNMSGFRNSSSASVTASSGSSLKIAASNLLSIEMGLSSLNIDGATLTPEFSPSVFEYSTTVTRSVTDLTVTAVPVDPNATVVVSGNTNLAIGDNDVTVKVTAQDGKTAQTFTIHVNRQESLVPENATITDKDGNIYLFAEHPDQLSLPEGFWQESGQINGSTVPVFVGNGISSMLLYLTSADTETGLYIYNPTLNSITLYDSEKVYFQAADLLCLSETPESSDIPDGFSKTTITFNGARTQGYVNSDKVKLVYLTNEAGESHFYVVSDDGVTLFLSQYCQEEGSGFLIPFILFAFISIAEFAMIIFIIRRVRMRNNNHEEVKRV